MSQDILEATFFLKIDEQTNLHFPHYNFAEEMFQTVQDNRDYLMKWLPWVEHTNKVQDTLNYIGESLKFNEGGQRLTTFIFYQEKVAGSISFVKVYKTHRRAEIGYWLRKDLQGKGIITKACKALLKHGFQKMDLNRIEIRADVKNTSSRKVPIRLGLREEGIFKEHEIRFEKFRDTVIYAMLKKEGF